MGPDLIRVIVEQRNYLACHLKGRQAFQLEKLIYQNLNMENKLFTGKSKILNVVYTAEVVFTKPQWNSTI